MPAWPKLKLPVLASLADELRFAPKAAVLRDIQRAAETIDLIDDEAAYPRSWIVFRLTGYRGEVEAELEPTPGTALRTELPRLIERLTAQSAVERADVKLFGTLLTQAEVCRRWKVDRKTVERYRKSGLVALRVRDTRGRSTLVFPEASVLAFERRHAERLKKAAAFSRTDDQTRNSLTERAAKLRARTGASTAKVAAHLAKKVGRSTSTVRRAVQRTTPRASTRRGSVELLTRWDAGEGVGSIAKAARRTRGAVIHSLLAARAQRLRALELSERVPSQGSPPRSLVEMDRVATVGELSEHTLRLLRASTLEDLLESMKSRNAMERATEAAWARTHHAGVALAARLMGRDAELPSADAIDEAECALRWALRARLELIAAQSALVVESIVAVAGEPERLEPSDLAAAILRGVAAVGGAIEGFLPPEAVRREIGGRLAAPVSLAVGKSLSEWFAGREKVLATRRATRSMAVPSPNWVDAACPWRAAVVASPTWLDPSVSASIEARQAEPDRRVWELRLGPRPRTVREVAAALGLSRPRAGEAVQRVVRVALSL
ncbi:MAG TPA: hypothetical protein VF777_10980 [Phycisphaerales bacterium]